MISVEFAHNPYLLETKVLFNGRPPKINSAIEKFEDKPLVEWANEVPGILHDEMNGYDFDLLYSGTALDFREVRQAFEEKGVLEDEVRIVHKGNLQPVQNKMEGIGRLVAWLEENPNRQFCFDALMSDNSELSESSFPCIFLHGRAQGVPQPMSAEEIEDKAELDNTDLTNTPIIYAIKPETSQTLKQDIEWLLGRADVKQNQLFFVIDPTMDADQVIRVLSDLGISQPKQINDADDEALAKFIEGRPLAEHVRECIRALKTEAQRISAILDEANKQYELENADDKARIDQIDRELDALKTAGETFENPDNLDTPRDYWFAKQKLSQDVLSWKSRKTKVTGEEEVASWAEDYKRAIDQFIAEFAECASQIAQTVRNEIYRDFEETYLAAGVDTGYGPEEKAVVAFGLPNVPDIRSALLSLVEVNYVAQKNDFFSLFNNAEPDANGNIKVVSCYLDKWRERVDALLEDMADELIGEHVEALGSYRENLAHQYKNHIAELIDQRRASRDDITSRMSGDAKALQEDNSWLADFKDKLQEIKRG